MKSYTDIEQSKALSKILPLKSADMFWMLESKDYYELVAIPYNESGADKNDGYPCWSLAALVEILPFHLIANNRSYAFSMVKGLNKDGETYAIKYAIFNTTFYLHLTDFYNNPVDACYEMIIKLHEQNLL